ncbi:hypothetical protein KR215_004639 [Drosophila sulfurigaster]|nr:hypothetical protein KR215_004639 [Drosophila sulfurigaster]
MSERNDANGNQEKLPWYHRLYNAIKEAPSQLTLLCVSALVYYKMKTSGRQSQGATGNRLAIAEPDIEYIDAQILAHRFSPSLHFKDFTLRELLKYNGTVEGERILFAVNNKIYDVSYAKHFYGPNGVHHHMAGRENTRLLLNLPPAEDPFKYDDLSSLTEAQRKELNDFTSVHMDRYSCIGIIIPSQEEDPLGYYEDDMDYMRWDD